MVFYTIIGAIFLFYIFSTFKCIEYGKRYGSLNGLKKFGVLHLVSIPIMILIIMGYVSAYGILGGGSENVFQLFSYFLFCLSLFTIWYGALQFHDIKQLLLIKIGLSIGIFTGILVFEGGIISLVVGIVIFALILNYKINLPK